MAGCLFCGDKPLSREHVWPDWLNDELPALRETTFTLNQVGKPTRTWKGQPASATVKVICKACNNGWMSDLERKAKPLLIPLIRGRTPVLDKPDQRVVAAWAFKTAAMLAQLNPGAVPVKPEQLAHLKSHGDPGPTVRVFAAASDAKGEADTFYRDTVLDLHVKPESGYPREAYVSTLAIRHLALQVGGAGFPDFELIHNAPFGAYVKKLWPFESSFKWPPGLILTPGVLFALADHWVRA